MPFNVDLGPSEWLILQAFFAVCGLLLLLAGARLVRLVVVLQGMVVGALMGATLVGSQISQTPLAVGSGALVGAVVLGFLALIILYLGLFMMGAAAAILLGGLVGLLTGSSPPPPMLLLLGLLGGLCAVFLRQWVLVVLTSWNGSGYVVGAGYSLLIGAQKTRALANDPAQLEQHAPLLLGLMGVLTVVGIVFQLTITEKTRARTPQRQPARSR